MKLKKILTVLLSVTILVAVLCSATVTASASAGTATVSVSSAEVDAGKTVDVELTMNAKGVAGFQGELRYDQAALELQNVTEAPGAAGNGMFMFSTGEEGKPYKNGSFFYAAANGKDFDGVILTFTFRAKENVSGKQKISVEALTVYDGTVGDPQPLETKIQGAASITIGSAGFSPLLLVLVILAVLLAVAAVLFVLARKNKARPHYYGARNNYESDYQSDYQSDDED